MALRTILTLPDPVLYRKARPVTKFDKDLQTLIDDMIDTMRDAPGVGLAAPQVGISERLIVVEYAEQPPAEQGEEIQEVKPRLYVMINPEILKTSEETVTGVEGCLSIPGLVGEVERFEEIQVRGLNRRGQAMKVKARGWLARIFQHEIDHINGVVFTQRATRIWKPVTEEEEQDRV
ncbi:MAG TPA: peptide deformylase [Anaerolineales bacterium]|nr:peptide deformylase [Anaerolineales bacterium]